MYEHPGSIGPYAVLGLLGEGGMGRVYLAVTPGSRMVAVKVVRPEYAQDARFRESFRREAAAVQRVSGAFTAPVLAADPDGSPPWLATLYTPAPSLSEFVSGYGPLPENAVRALGTGLAEALSSIHAAGVLHRDLKPGNVLLTSTGPLVIDFGISKQADDGAALTRTGASPGGTPGFMPPEQITADRPVAEPADVFALGAVLVYAATCHGPFAGPGDAGAALYYRAVYAEPDLNGVPERLVPIVSACLEKDPARRPTPAAVLEALSPVDPQALALRELAAESQRRAEWAALQSRPQAGHPQWVAARQPAPGPRDRMQSPDRPGFGVTRRPLLAAAAGGFAAVAGGGVLAWDLLRGSGSNSGSDRPTTLTPAWSRKAPVPGDTFAFAGDTVIWYAATAGACTGLAAETGEVRFSHAMPFAASDPLAAQGFDVAPWFGVYDSVLYGSLMTQAGESRLLGLNGTGKQVSLRAMPPAPNTTLCGIVDGNIALFYSDMLKSGQYYAVDLDTGSTLWSRSLKLVTLYQTGSDNVAHSDYFSYAITDGTRFYMHADTTTYALDPRTGSVLWSNPGTVVSGITPWLAVCGETLVVSGNKLIGLDRATGKQMWKALDLYEPGPGRQPPDPTSPTILSIPAVIGGSDDRIVVFDDANSAYAVNAANGSTLWKRTESFIAAPVNATAGQALFASNQVVAASATLNTTTGAYSATGSMTETPVGRPSVIALSTSTGAALALSADASASGSEPGDDDTSPTTMTTAVQAGYVYAGYESYVYAFKVGQ